MKVCTFCGCKTDDNNKVCASCGGSTFKRVCLNCNEEYDGLYCPSCGTRFDAVEKICPNCSTRYYSNACPECGYIPNHTNVKREIPLEKNNKRYSKTASKSTSDITTLIFGLLGLFTCIFPFAIAAVVYGHVNKKNGNNTFYNKVGYILGILGIIFGVIYLIAYIFYLINGK